MSKRVSIGGLEAPKAVSPPGALGGVASAGPPGRFDFLAVPFQFPKVEGKKVLIVGVGGGCDIITAYGLAEQLRAGQPQALVYGNTKRRIHRGLTHLTKHIYCIPGWMRALRLLASKRNATRIEQTVPPGDEGSPWILHLSKHSDSRHRLAEELAEQGFDLVIAIDSGGDSVVESATSGERGTDKLMLAALKSLGAPFLLVVAGPGCDGEAPFEDLVQAFEQLRSEGRYLGCFSLSPLMSIFAAYGASLEPIRTTNILLAAHERRLETGAQPDTFIVPRGVKPAIPAVWLLQAFVFQH
jgi:hypothetical protein